MLAEILQDKKLILASNSPRRKQFLEALQLTFQVHPSDVSEDYPKNLQKEAITAYIALEKARYFKNIAPENIIITCDTLVWHKNEALGKPKDFDEAFAMLQSLADQTHEVISSVCLKSAQKEIVFSDCTQVTFGPLSSAEITYYIEHFQPYDKAGSYGIQEWIGLIGIQKIKGSYSNVVGMPMEKLYHQLLHF